MGHNVVTDEYEIPVTAVTAMSSIATLHWCSPDEVWIVASGL
jgi:hypothetical protein